MITSKLGIIQLTRPEIEEAVAQRRKQCPMTPERMMKRLRAERQKKKKRRQNIAAYRV